MNQFDWIAKWALYNEEAKAVKEFETGKELTYGQLNRIANRVSSVFLNEYKLKKGDRVAVLAENCSEYIILFSVMQKTGLVLVPLNFRLTSPELNYILENAEASLVITETKFLEKITATDAYNSVKNKLILKDFEIICARGNDNHAPDFKSARLNENDPLFILYTSGTTAFPKGAIYTHKMLFWNSINTEIRLDITSSDISLDAAPPFHTGFWNVLLTPFIHHGAYTILMKNFDAENVLNLIEKEKLTIWWAVPTMLKMISETSLFKQTDISNLRYMVVGGEAMPIPLIKKWHSKNVPIRQGYGLTEVGPNITSLPEKDAITKQGSIGTPNFYVETKIVDDKGNEITGSGGGELLLKGPNVTPGYWKNDEATENTIVDGWFHTGDVVSRDDDGYFYVIDRIKNMYISGGENVYPAEVEHLIRKLPGINDLIIIGVPDEKWGEAGKAFIVKEKDIQINEKDILDYCRANLAKYKIPKYVEFIDELPKNDAGKVDRKKLKQQDSDIS